MRARSDNERFSPVFIENVLAVAGRIEQTRIDKSVDFAAAPKGSGIETYSPFFDVEMYARKRVCLDFVRIENFLYV